jgi:hypothetical protein
MITWAVARPDPGPASGWARRMHPDWAGPVGAGQWALGGPGRPYWCACVRHRPDTSEPGVRACVRACVWRPWRPAARRGSPESEPRLRLCRRPRPPPACACGFRSALPVCNHARQCRSQGPSLPSPSSPRAGCTGRTATAWDDASTRACASIRERVRTHLLRRRACAGMLRRRASATVCAHLVLTEN